MVQYSELAARILMPSQATFGEDWPGVGYRGLRSMESDVDGW
jgi:hypothetical protein